MTAKLTFVVPMQTVRILSANARSHWAVKARETRTMRALARSAAALKPARFKRAHVTVEIGWPDRRRRDAGNAYPLAKALVDGVTDAGWLPDDDDKHLTGPDLRSLFCGRRGMAVVTLTFEEVEG